MCEATLGEIAISLVLVISCEPVKVESESRNFSEEQRVENNHWDSLFQYSCHHVYIGTLPFSLMGNQTVHKDSFKYKYMLS